MLEDAKATEQSHQLNPCNIVEGQKVGPCFFVVVLCVRVRACLKEGKERLIVKNMFFKRELCHAKYTP